MKKLTRREFLIASTTTTAAALLAACAPKSAPAEPTQAPESTKAPEPTKAVAAEATQAPTTAPTAAPTAVPEAAGCQMDWSPTFPPVPKKYSPPVQISMPFRTGPFDTGELPTDNPRYNEVKENLGVEFIPFSLQGDKIELAIAAGELPDAFSVGGTLLAGLIQDNALVDIKSIWESTASDLVKTKRLYPDGDNWVPVMQDGKVWGIPIASGPAHHVENIGWIRQDWLDQVGLSMPQTLDDLEQAMKAFIDDGLAKFGITANKNLVTWYQSLDPIFGAYGVMPKVWKEAGDGTLIYSGIEPGVKDALAKLNAWYQDGLLDPDFYTYGEGDAASAVGAGRIGAFFGPHWSIGALIVDAEKQNPGANFVVMPYPKGPEGKFGRKSQGLLESAVVFKKDTDPQKIEASINVLNWQTEIHVNFDKYQQYGESLWTNDYVFEEGYAWEWDENCELKAGAKSGQGEWFTAGWGWWFPYGCYPDYKLDLDKTIVSWYDADPATLNKAQRFMISNPNGKRNMEAYMFVATETEGAYVDRWLGVATEQMVRLMPELQKLEDEYYIKIIIGEKPLDAFEEFVETWKQSGGDAVAADINAWFKTRK